MAYVDAAELEGLVKARAAAIEVFQEHAGECPSCKPSIMRLEPGTDCEVGKFLERELGDAWAAWSAKDQRLRGGI
jgi:hypothetical protein